MGQKDPRVNAYIAKAQPFAKPILVHLRKLVHTACPDIEETIKWGMPAFYYKGPLFGMASFKQHCAFNFWKGELISKVDKSFVSHNEEAMGDMGRIARKEDIPPDKQMLKWLKIAVKLNDDGVKRVVPRSKTPKPLVVPDYFVAALKKNKKALATFEGFSPSHKREYVEWVTGAKQEETRMRRMATAVEWMAEGKSQNWRYERKS